jgi:uncharacterized membrane protein
MTLELWLHFAHVAAALVWFGGGVTLSLVGVRARQSGSLDVIGEFARTLSYLGLRVFTPAVLVVLVSGVGLVLVSSRWSLSQLWVLLGLGAFALAFLIGAVYLSRSALQLERAANQNADLKAAREALGRWLAGYGLVLIVLVFALWDMIFKPGI